MRLKFYGIAGTACFLFLFFAGLSRIIRIILEIKSGEKAFIIGREHLEQAKIISGFYLSADERKQFVKWLGPGKLVRKKEDISGFLKYEKWFSLRFAVRAPGTDSSDNRLWHFRGEVFKNEERLPWEEPVADSPEFLYYDGLPHHKTRGIE